MQSAGTASRSAGALLSEAESRTRLGQYDYALSILEGIERDFRAEHSAHWMGIVCAAAARNKLHSQDDQGALQFIGLISAELRAANPKIDAECYIILGIVCRRDAHRCWKNRQDARALASVGRAIDAFERARICAEMGLEDRLRHNAVLNRLYATGLQYAIENRPKGDFAALLAEAIVVEVASRETTPPCVRDDLTGMTIVADLAFGGGIGLDALRAVSDDPAFQRAIRYINPHECTNWAELILRYVRAAEAGKPDVLTRALLLGCKMLLADERTPCGEVLAEYAGRLRLHHLDLECMKSNRLLQGRIVEMLSRVPQEVTRRVMRPRFLR